MNLRRLEAFRATMRTGSITGASQLMHISQPSVSRLISDLEESIGFKLFLPAGRGLVSTVEARRFYQGVEGMFVGVERLSELANAIRTTSGGTVAVGVIPAFSTIGVPSAVSELYRTRPDVKIMLSMRNTPAILDAVQMLQLDLGIVGRQPPYEGVETLYQTALPYVCLMPEDHPFSSEEGAIDLEKLADREPFITFGGIFPDEMLEIDSDLSERLRKNSRLSAANMPLAASLVRETGAFAIVDPVSAEIASRVGGVITRPLVQHLKYHLAIITRGRDTLSLEADILCDLIIDRFEQFEKAPD